MEDYLLQEERILTRSQSDEIILTTHRIRQHFGSTNIKSIMLDQISCIKARSESNPVLLVLGIAALLATPFMLGEAERNYGITTCIVGIVLSLLYYFSRRSIISIYAGQHIIQFSTKGIDEDKSLEFINAVEEARKNLMRF